MSLSFFLFYFWLILILTLILILVRCFKSGFGLVWRGTKEMMGEEEGRWERAFWV